MILAPLRGVTIRCFRECFAHTLNEYGFTEAVTPFITANAGFDPMKDRELFNLSPESWENGIKITPQFIGKDPQALRYCLERIKDAGFATADLNCGCPFPMVRNKFRGSGILKTRDVLAKMLEVGCDVMGPNAFSIKVRLGVDSTDELYSLMSLINSFPLRYLTVHARTARQMYDGHCDIASFIKVAGSSRNPIVYNGDAIVESGVLRGPLSDADFEKNHISDVMIGRGFIKALAIHRDISSLLHNYIESSLNELHGERSVLGRVKELVSYWKDIPNWRSRWNGVKISRTLDELRMCLGI